MPTLGEVPWQGPHCWGFYLAPKSQEQGEPRGAMEEGNQLPGAEPTGLHTEGRALPPDHVSWPPLSAQRRASSSLQAHSAYRRENHPGIQQVPKHGERRNTREGKRPGFIPRAGRCIPAAPPLTPVDAHTCSPALAAIGGPTEAKAALEEGPDRCGAGSSTAQCPAPGWPA